MSVRLRDVINAMGGVEVDVEDEIPPKYGIKDGLDEGQREHIRVEEEILLPVYSRAGRIPGGNPEFYINEHKKMLAILDDFKETLPHLIQKSPGEARREIIELFDQGYWFKRLLEHHDNREENILYPVLDKVTGEEERKELLKKCFPE